MMKGFTKQYNIKKLLHYELCDTAEQAIAREKQLKNWHRDWKFNLIRSSNPTMRDLYLELTEMSKEIPKQVRDDALWQGER